MTNSPIKRIFKECQIKPNKLLGQNFLIDRAVLKKIIAAADLSKDDIVLEIGPGLGILTEELAKHVGQVVAVEKDKKMAEIVRNIIKDKNVKNVEIVEGDILKINPSVLAFSHPERSEGSLANASANKLRDSSPRQGGAQNDIHCNYRVVANIPYYLTSHLIRKFLESDNQPQEMILMVQKEVTQRICAKPPEMSLLAVAVQFYAQPKIVSYVSKNSFWPRPKVDSAIIKITLYATPIHGFHTDDTDNIICVGASALLETERRKRAFRVQFFRVVRAGFAHPRKQLINNLSQGLKIDRVKISETLKKIGLAPEQRAETLSVNDWIKLSERLQF